MDTIGTKNIWKIYGECQIVLGKLRMNNDYNFWRNKKVLITGHTGFKGPWLSLLLYNFGAKLYGYSLRPENGHLFQKAKLSRIFAKSIY